MRAPRIVILGLDDWLAKQLRPLAEEHRWLLSDYRQLNAARAALGNRPTVLVLQVDPHADQSPGLALLAEVHHALPDVAAVVISDGKLPDDDRARWTAAAFDLGAAFVLFPPLTGPVLEDLVGGLMAALLPRAGEDVIDLAEEGTVPE